MSREVQPLSAVDAAWLRMDRPSNLMMITSLVEVEGRLSRAALEEVIRDRLLAHPRFVQRVETRAVGRPRWVPDRAFALATHVHEVGLPAPGDDAALRALVCDLASTPIERSHPLWQVHLVDRGDRGTAVVVRLHHCLADGVALIRLLLELTDHGEARVRDVGPRRDGGASTWVRDVVKGAGRIGRILMMPPDPSTAIHGKLGPRKQLAWSAPVKQAPIVEAAHAIGGTLNDLLVAAITGALRGYLEARAAMMPGLEVRALMPVNLRRALDDTAREEGNRFGLVFVPLPLSEPTPERRLTAVHARMDEVKSSPEAVAAFGVIGAMGLVSAAVERFGIELFTRKATLLITNVPGPATEVRLAGHRVRGLVAWAPASGAVGMTMSLVSYGGDVRLGVSGDERLVPDPAALCERFVDEVRALAPGACAPEAGPPT
jgi:hypothetical protein